MERFIEAISEEKQEMNMKTNKQTTKEQRNKNELIVIKKTK